MTPLPGLLPDMAYVDLRGKTPQQFAAMIVGKLAALGVATMTSVDAGGPARDMAAPRPAGAVRAGEADPRRLGVHAAISVPGVPDEVPPEYVPRDVDIAEFGIRARVKAAAQRGGFVLLVGGSSVGKTRCAVQAVKALLPDWWLLHPAGPGEVAGLSQAPLPRTVVWLDELQRYLDGEHGLTGAMVRALLNGPHPAVIIGTLWPDRYTTYTAMPKSGRPDPHTREREVLNLAEVVRIGPEFSPAEQGRARAAAGRDPRLQIALDAARCGLTQTLAAAPQLVARWEDARTAHPYGWAVLTAALDLTRLGARAPLSIDLLRAAAPGYCASNQQAEAPDNWFEQALAYATAKLHGAVAALSPAGAGMGQVAGYTAADYLIQHASGERRYARMPASTWDAAISHLRDPADTARLADSARNRLLYRYAMPLYRQAADVGDGDAARRLADLLAERGDLTRGGPDPDATGPASATGMPPGGWPGCWPSAATCARRSRSCATGPTSATGRRPGNWPICCTSAVTRTSCAPGPTPATMPPPGCWTACWPGAATWTRCMTGKTPATRMPPGGWTSTGPMSWPSTATWTGCVTGPIPATGMPPWSWPGCWPSAVIRPWPNRSCGTGPTPATGRRLGDWPIC